MQLLYFLYLIAVYKALPALSAESDVFVDLTGYLTEGDPYRLVKTLVADSLTAVRVSGVPPDAGFLVIQSHSHLYRLTLSYAYPLAEDSYINGTHLGLVYYITKTLGADSYIINHNTFNVTTMIVVTLYSNRAPIPGGCNMEFPTTIAPYLDLSYNSVFITVSGQPSLEPQNVRPPENACHLSNLEYQIFRLYTTEMDFSPTTFFQGISAMLTPQSILNSSQKISIRPEEPIMGMYGAYCGTGSIFAVTVQSKYGISAYVPVHTYSCNISQNTDSCQVTSTTVTKLICAIVIVVGFVLCFGGHNFLYFYMEMFVMGSISGGLIFYILLNINSSTPPGSTIGATAIGLACGVVWFLVWCIIQSPLVSVFVPLLNLGIMVASLIFFTGISDFYPLIESNLYYWTIFSSIVLFAALFFTTMPRVSNLISCTIFGGYAVILPMDYYGGTSLKYIFLNVIYRATVEGFERAKISPPFQVPDILLTLCWCCFTIVGIAHQMEKGLPAFPPPINLCKRRSDSEVTTPLLSETRVSHHSPGSDNVFVA